jgi:hypothetical protein
MTSVGEDIYKTAYVIYSPTGLLNYYKDSLK